MTRVEGTTALLHEREHVLVTICTELKTSLIAIAGVAQLLIGRQQELAQPDHARTQDDQQDLIGYLEQIRSETQQLAHRVNTALQVTRSESVELAPTSGRATLSQVSLDGLGIDEQAPVRT
jgi:signal transduction histidine kinase